MVIRYDYVLHHVSVQGIAHHKGTVKSIRSFLITGGTPGENCKSGISAMRVFNTASPSDDGEDDIHLWEDNQRPSRNTGYNMAIGAMTGRSLDPYLGPARRRDRNHVFEFRWYRRTYLGGDQCGLLTNLATL
ncbi:hypothetical protein [Rhizobium grahamii]|uniref:hypothetical protein n=1 Tax=Rhizobium grahamii TaxID=1120045 RepID=UPI00167BAC45